MKKLIAVVGAMFLCLFSASLAQEAIDAKFPALLTWADWLTENGALWNKMCTERPSNEGCADMRLILNEQYVMFIEAALRYTTQGTDCRAVLRPQAVKWEVMNATYNINCAGKPITEGCKNESAALEKRRLELQKQIDACTNSTKL